MSCSSWVRVILWGLSGSCSFRPASEPVPVRLSADGIALRVDTELVAMYASYAPGSSWVGLATRKPSDCRGLLPLSPELPLDDCAPGAAAPSAVKLTTAGSIAAAGMILMNSLRLMMCPYCPCGQFVWLLSGHRPSDQALQAVAKCIPDQPAHTMLQPASIGKNWPVMPVALPSIRAATKLAASSGWINLFMGNPASASLRFAGSLSAPTMWR